MSHRTRERPAECLARVGNLRPALNRCFRNRILDDPSTSKIRFLKQRFGAGRRLPTAGTYSLTGPPRRGTTRSAIRSPKPPRWRSRAGAFEGEEATYPRPQEPLSPFEFTDRPLYYSRGSEVEKVAAICTFSSFRREVPPG
ncbi:hypothetical protein EVAR_18549_1 [Eumeta japonica]|uniref:Uncharacterized protein n=1 Tax=Eumeta variegata TaxID=151549 RepID=A0A4C1V2R4_EUMVA|nr:hypothetical protein EVAR_18549_1 [Eumeta japonica]